MTIFSFGTPMAVGGANSERFHTMLLWRRMGLPVTCVVPRACICKTPVPPFNPSDPMGTTLRDAGVDFVLSEPGQMRSIPGLSGSIVVEFCSPHIRCLWPELHGMGVRLIHSPTMAGFEVYERELAFHAPPAAIHYQSHYLQQASRLQWEEAGVCVHETIHGAFDPSQFPWNPLPRDGPFHIGRLARVHRSKWNPNLFDIIGKVRGKGVDAYLACQGWTYDLTVHCGNPPAFATCLPAGTNPPQEFYSQCHAIICPNWSVAENWPRIGLEAMACGVAIVADKAGGWEEMIDSGYSGYLCSNQKEFVSRLVELAEHEDVRQMMISNAYTKLQSLCNPDDLGEQWTSLFAKVA